MFVTTLCHFKLIIYLCNPVVPAKDIKRIRRKFLEVSQNDEMTQAEFFTIQCKILFFIKDLFKYRIAVKINPLKDRLFRCFDTSEDKLISFSVLF